MVASTGTTTTTLLHCDAETFDGSAITRSAPVTAPGGGDFYIALTCVKLPTDGLIGVTVMGPASDSCVIMPITRILTPSMQLQWRLIWPVNFQSEVVVDYVMGAAMPPAGAYFEVTLLTPEAPADNTGFVAA